MADVIDDLLAQYGGSTVPQAAAGAPAASASMPAPEAKSAPPINIDGILNRYLSKDGDLRPAYAQGQSADTPIAESPLDPMDRLKYSTLWGNKDRIARQLQESGKFQDVKVNSAGQVVMLDQDGAWKSFDPNNGAWETTKNLVKGGLKALTGWQLNSKEREAYSDLADTAPELAVQAGLLALTGPIGSAVEGLGLGAAAEGAGALARAGAFALEKGAEGVALGGVAAAERTALSSLGRLAGTYSATPEEQFRDGLLEMGMMAAGNVALAGTIASGKGLYKLIADSVGKSGGSEIASGFMNGYLRMAQNGRLGDEAINEALNDPKGLSRLMQDLNLHPDGLEIAATDNQKRAITGILKNINKVNSQAQEEITNRLMSAFPEDVAMNSKEVFQPLQEAMAESGLVRGVGKNGELYRGVNLIKALQDKTEGIALQVARKPEHVIENLGEAAGADITGWTQSQAAPVLEKAAALQRAIDKAGDLKGRGALRKFINETGALQEDIRTLLNASENSATARTQLSKFNSALQDGIDQMVGKGGPKIQEAYQTFRNSRQQLHMAISPFTTASKQYFNSDNPAGVMAGLIRDFSGASSSRMAESAQNQLPELVRALRGLELHAPASALQESFKEISKNAAAKAFSIPLSRKGIDRAITGTAIGLANGVKEGASDGISKAGLSYLASASVFSPRAQLWALKTLGQTEGISKGMSDAMMRVVNNARNRVGVKTFQKVLANPSNRDAIMMSILNADAVRPMVNKYGQ